MPAGIQKGNLDMLVVGGIVLFSVLIGGGLFFNDILRIAPSQQALAICCDTGDGDQCVPQKSRTLIFSSPTSLTFPQYKNTPEQYDLLKSNTKIYNCFEHGKDSHQTVTYPDGKVHPIILNDSQDIAGTVNECRETEVDQIADFRPGAKNACFAIPDDELVYVCKQNCNAPRDNFCYPGIPVFGNSTTVYDVYIRDKDIPVPGVPDVIKNCQKIPNTIVTPTPIPKSPGPSGNKTNSTLLFNPYTAHKTLQLHTFNFDQGISSIGFPRPWCKPAIYLYPPKTEAITVQIAPQGKLLQTIPPYPENGWQVTANPNGTIISHQQTFDYLYYEASISDSLLPTENTGYVVAYDSLDSFFKTMLPKLGLIEKEQNQFREYWLKALPQSPFYKISLIPQNTLDSISPLSISPTPNTTLRVTLHFEPLSNFQFILPPSLPKVNRTGFTVVEWAGMFKQDKNHPFTCLQ